MTERVENPAEPGALLHTGTSGGVLTLTLDSPRNRNALSSALIDRLLTAFAGASADPAVRVVVLSHTGPVFCSGADLAETAAVIAGPTSPHPASPSRPTAPPSPTASPSPPRVPAARLGELLAAIVECPKPVVARVAGPARAGGLGLIAAADIAVCARPATFAFSEVRIGVVPAVISAAVLPRLTSRAAAELYLTG
jgi:methylglutaconyl-CoA hydratase